MTTVHEGLFLLRIAGAGFDPATLDGPVPESMRRARALLKARPRVPGAQEIVRRRLRRYACFLFLPSNLKSPFRSALFPRGVEDGAVRAHRVWVDRVSFEGDWPLPTLDVRGLVRLPLRRPITAEELAGLEARHEDRLVYGINFELHFPHDSVWSLDYVDYDVTPVASEAEAASMPRLPR